MHKCKVCGYIYDSEFGDPAQGIEQGTDFDELPPTWRCPICGVSKDDFIELPVD
jgi:rubredoxin